MKASEIRKILKLAKQFGVKELTMGGLTVSFYEPKRVKNKAKRVSASAALQSTHSALTPDEPTDTTHDLATMGFPTQDELMLMSTPFYDQMQEYKRLKDSGDVTDETQFDN